VKIAKRARLLALCPALAACEPDRPAERTLLIDARAPAACPVPASAVLELEALGDFEASNRTAELVPAGASRELTFPLSTRAVSAVARDGGEHWLGLADVQGDSAALALWPENGSCALFQAEAETYPRTLEGHGASVSADGRVVLIAGGLGQDGAETLLFDVGTLATGSAANGLSALRAWPSVTAFGSGFLVAGGQDPGRVLDDADIVDATTTAGVPETIRLGQRRARHAGVVLASGDTLLVGGHGDEPEHPLSPLVVIPVVPPHKPRVAGLALVATARLDPVALRLSDGRILVGAGIDAERRAVTTVEWLTPDASRAARPPVDLADFGAAARLVFTALPGGSVLAAARAANGDALAFWISPEGFVEPLAVPAAPAGDWEPLLIPASDGSPFLVIGPSGTQRVLRFNPWERSNRPFRDAALELDGPLPGAGAKPVAIDGGAFVWLGQDGEGVKLFGLRHDVRGAYARDVALLTPDPEDPLQPLHIAPDWRSGPDTLVYDGKLRLGGDGSAPTQRVASVFVTDALYADFDLTLGLEAGPPPLVLLGNVELGGPACAWPEPGSAPEELRVLRRERAVLLLRGGVQSTCEVAAERSPIGLKQGGAEPTVVASLTIRRAILAE
jgi:hypothetical protein